MGKALSRSEQQFAKHGFNKQDKAYFWYNPLHRCVLALYTQYFPELCEQKTQLYYLGGI